VPNSKDTKSAKPQSVPRGVTPLDFRTRY
jgi:hypothetical protein